MRSKETRLAAPTPLAAALYNVRPALAGVGVFSFFINILMLATPLYMLAVFQRVLTSGHGDTLLFLTLLVIFALLVMGALLAVRSWVPLFVLVIFFLHPCSVSTAWSACCCFSGLRF